jgi:hypothetical protein
MPHSPYHNVVYAPINDLEGYRRDLRHARSHFEEGSEWRQDPEEELLGAAECLLDHCDFLETKLDIKVRIHFAFLLIML